MEHETPRPLGARRIAFLTDPAFENDRLFAPGSRDGSLEPYRRLRDRLVSAGRHVHTADAFERTGETPDLVVCLNAPEKPLSAVLPKGWSNVPCWALLLEAEVVTPQNWRPDVQAQFGRLFTWRDSFVDGRRFFKLDLPNLVDRSVAVEADPPRLSALVAANKVSHHPLELYSERRSLIRWFERHRPADLDLYGVGWDLLVLDGPRPVRALNVLLPDTVRRALAPRFPSYRGSVGEKREVLRNYRFTFCFENARDIEGYVSEKLFDALLAGSIPVYWGAPDITERVPPECFVDFREFASWQALYDHISSLSAPARARLRRAGRDFVTSDGATPFSAESWVKILLSHL